MRRRRGRGQFKRRNAERLVEIERKWRAITMEGITRAGRGEAKRSKYEGWSTILRLTYTEGRALPSYIRMKHGSFPTGTSA
jgi:hypothetical protein